MGKNISPIVKFQGTVGDQVHVNSKTYKPHVRSRKYSKTPFTWTDNFAENNKRLHACNEYGHVIFQALRSESHDGMLWSRMVKRFFAGLKAGEPLSLEMLKDLQCNLTHPLEEVITGAYDFSATREQNEVRIRVELEKHPKVDDTMPRTGYQLRVVAISRDPANGNVIKREALGPLTQYKSALEAVNLTIPLPSPDVSCMLVLGIVPHMRNEGAVRIMSDSGMKVVWVSEVKPEVGSMKSEVGGMMVEVENQVLEVDRVKPEDVGPLAEGGSPQLAVDNPQPEAGSLKPATPVQASTGSGSYWQHSTAMGFVHYTVSKSS